MIAICGVRRYSRPHVHGDSAESFVVTDVVGARPGPKLAVLAGMHINEVSSIEAARRLVTIPASELSGTLSVITVLNTPAWRRRSIGVCPVDDRNINFCFPGDSRGTFSQKVAFDLLNEWAADAVCLVDLHGGDLCEDIIKYSICQMTGDASFDEEALLLAKAFDVQVVVALGQEYLASPGRSVTGRATRMQLGAFAEAGSGGLVAETDVRMHYDGVLRLAAYFGMLTGHSLPDTADPAYDPVILTNYVWVPAPKSGWCEMRTRAGEHVSGGSVVATVTELDGSNGSDVLSPADGIVLWCDTHPAVSAGDHVAGIAY